MDFTGNHTKKGLWLDIENTLYCCHNYSVLYGSGVSQETGAYCQVLVKIF